MPAVNSELILHAEFYDRGGALIDPSAVRGNVLQPNNVQSPLTFTKIATGVWEAIFTPIMSGRHYWRAEGSGNVVAATEGHFDVDEQRVTVP